MAVAMAERRLVHHLSHRHRRAGHRRGFDRATAGSGTGNHPGDSRFLEIPRGAFNADRCHDGASHYHGRNLLTPQMGHGALSREGHDVTLTDPAQAGTAREITVHYVST